MCGRRISTARSDVRAATVGRRPDWKKAYVTLKEGEKMIEFSEAVSKSRSWAKSCRYQDLQAHVTGDPVPDDAG